MRKYLIIFFLLVLTVKGNAQTPADSAFISVLTCSPGEELYARYGHIAIRVCVPDVNLDICYNYGEFDFNTDHFYWKFVKGETWYQLGVCDTKLFRQWYEAEGRVVNEQVLNLTEEQVAAYAKALAINFQPENRKYLYNFVFDNCATRPYLLMEKALGPISSTYEGNVHHTYRRFIQHYTRKGSWADLGINIIFGRKADQKMESKDRLFLPEELMYYLSEATLADGTPLVREEHIQPFEIQPVRWYEAWYGPVAIFMLLSLILAWLDRKKGKYRLPSKLMDGVFALIVIVLFIIQVFLTFFSIHPLVGLGIRLTYLVIAYLCTKLIYIIR